MMSIDIREAIESDAPGIGQVHVDSWRSTYDGIVSHQFLASLSYEKRSAAALKRIQDPAIDCFVASDRAERKVIGFADIGLSREKKLANKGELFAIYLLQDYQGKGVGRKLFEIATRTLINRGFDSYFVSVLSENTGAISFYKKMGGKFIGNDNVDIDGQRHITDTFEWNSKGK